MFGLMVAAGSFSRRLTEEKLKACWPEVSDAYILSPLPDILIGRFMPRNFSQGPDFAWSEDRKIVVCVDGYLITDKAKSGMDLQEQIRVFAQTCRASGFQAALDSIINGAYTLVVADLSDSKCFVTNDHVGALPLYYSTSGDGWLVSTNPVALAATGLINREIDLVACAEWTHTGSPIGPRYTLKGIRQFFPYHCLQWGGTNGSGQFKANSNSPWDILPADKSPSVDDVADAFIDGCRLLSTIDPKPAHFQSAGKDSRLILACWPSEYNPHCYTYGDPESLEIEVARSIAALRGSPWTHIWIEADEVADNILKLFNAGGMVIWPDRWFTARQMHLDGHRGNTDGYWGGVQVHPGAYNCDKYFSIRSKIGRKMTIFIDQKVSSPGLDRVSETMYEFLHYGPWLPSYLETFLAPDFVDTLERQKPEMLQDIHDELKRLLPANDSLAILWRNYIASNRGNHQHAQQGVMCRSFMNVYYPHCADLKYHRLQLLTKPSTSAYDRRYIKIYRRRFPEYGKIPYGNTLLPLNTGPFRTQLSDFLISRGFQLPFLTGRTGGRERDANSWGAWLRESGKLRQIAIDFLRAGNIINEERAAREMNEYASGRKSGTGQVFHLASIGRWLAMSQKRT
jgi:hypothetical protein